MGVLQGRELMGVNIKKYSEGGEAASSPSGGKKDALRHENHMRFKTLGIAAIVVA